MLETRAYYATTGECFAEAIISTSIFQPANIDFLPYNCSCLIWTWLIVSLS